MYIYSVLKKIGVLMGKNADISKISVAAAGFFWHFGLVHHLESTKIFESIYSQIDQEITEPKLAKSLHLACLNIIVHWHYFQKRKFLK